MSGDQQDPAARDELASALPQPQRSNVIRTSAVSRRHLLAAGTLSGGALLLGATLRNPVTAQEGQATPDAHSAHASPVPQATPSWLLFEPSELVEPEVRSATDGMLSTQLNVDYTFLDIGGFRLHMRAYEGGAPGPTLRLQPGDTLKITLSNNLPPNSDPTPAQLDLPHHFNTTNVHTHGLHVSPEGISDNIFRSMEPGGTYEIEIAIPADHPRGTYWYHPHHHGSADAQITSGMVGALIVEGDFAEVPEIAAAQERVLILSEILFNYLGVIEDYDTLWPEAVPRFLAVNGQREPIIQMRPGEVQRWRVVQACHESNLRFALEEHTLHAIAYDGISAGQIEGMENMEIAPGQRVDFLVQAGEPGEYALAAIANDQGYPSPTGPLGRVVVSGEPVSMALPTALPTPPLAPIADDEIVGQRLLTLSGTEPEFPPAANYQEFTFTVDGRVFDPNRVDQRMTLGTAEEWTIVNEQPADHVFHIHTNPFLLTHINGETLETPRWLDTAIVPGSGSITFRTRFTDFAGKTVLHCHMMNHEELGMMQVIEFVTSA